MDADKRVRRWAALNVRNELNWPRIGTHEGMRVDHYRSCPDLQVEVVEMWESWYSDVTFEGWNVRVLVTCPHGQVETNHGITPLTPVERTLAVYDLDDILEELDAQEPPTPS